MTPIGWVGFGLIIGWVLLTWILPRVVRWRVCSRNGHEWFLTYSGYPYAHGRPRGRCRRCGAWEP